VIDQKRPAISVVVPLYNKQEYIGRCLNSILAQTMRKFEIVVVDDGSTDGGLDFVRAIPDERLRIITQQNAGPGAARNRGVAESKADLVALLDADDEWMPGFLEAIHDLSLRHPQAGLFATGYRRLLDTGHVREVTLRGSGRSSHLIENYFSLARTSEFVTCSSVAIRKDVFAQVGGFLERARFGEDLDLWARIAARYPIACDSRVLAIYHSEAQGRSFELRGTKAPYPVIVNRLRELARSFRPNDGVAREIETYADFRLVQHAYWLLSLRERAKLVEFLRTERFSTWRYGMEALLLKTAVAAVPMRIIEAVKVRSARLKSPMLELFNPPASGRTVSVCVRAIKTNSR
jgi:glycosyltransferase involved in cell wall biosynthesis